jgi:4-amino-4-deoxy-L-arabinose transferase-like glycosyltransferase
MMMRRASTDTVHPHSMTFVTSLRETNSRSTFPQVSFHPRPRVSYRWLCFSLLLFLLQVLPYLSCRWVTDESWYAATAYSMEHGNGIRNPAIGPNDIENHLDVRPPGTAAVIAAAFRLFGVGAAAARLGSVLAGLTVVFFTYRLSREFIGEEGAIIATLLTATDNLIVLTSRTARPEALTTMAVLAALLAMTQYAKTSRVIWSFLGGLLIAMAAMFHVTVLGYIVSLGILALIIDRKVPIFQGRGAVAYVGGVLLGIAPFAVWIMTARMGREGFREEYLNRAANSSLWSRLVQEGHRYSYLAGLDIIHGHGLESIPIRLPIVLFFLAASIVLWKYRRQYFYLELILLVPSVVWLAYTVNKSPRYVAIVAPLFGMVIGAAAFATRANRRAHRLSLSIASLMIAAQMSSNIILLHAARRANYSEVSTRLLEMIPPGETAYGTMTLWLTFHDRPFISYERTDPHMAIRAFDARYFIVGDRMLTSSGGPDAQFYNDLNERLAAVIAHSKIVGDVDDPYYGDLRVYRFTN